MARTTKPTAIEPSALARDAEFLFGRWWRSPLARQLGISLATVRNYERGKAPISGPVAVAVRLLVAEKRRLPHEYPHGESRESY